MYRSTCTATRTGQAENRNRGFIAVANQTKADKFKHFGRLR